MWLSVLMPTYNGGAHLRVALESIAQQCATCSNADVEVIAVDDGSTDETIEILQSYQTRLALTILRSGHTGNWVRNVNRALRHATGEYVCWLHQDDYWLDGRVRTLRELSLRWPSASLIMHPSRFVDRDGRDLGRWSCKLPNEERLFNGDELMLTFAVHDPIAACAAVFRRDAVASVGEPDESLWYLGDWEFWLRLIRHGGTIYCPRPLTAFRLHADSQTARRTVDTKDVRVQFTRVLDRHLTDIGQANGAGGGVEALGRLSAEVDLLLIHAYHGKWPAIGRFVSAAWQVGLSGGLQYLKYSRLVERVRPRLRTLLFQRQRSSNSRTIPPRTGMRAVSTRTGLKVQ